MFSVLTIIFFFKQNNYFRSIEKLEKLKSYFSLNSLGTVKVCGKKCNIFFFIWKRRQPDFKQPRGLQQLPGSLASIQLIRLRSEKSSWILWHWKDPRMPVKKKGGLMRFPVYVCPFSWFCICSLNCIPFESKVLLSVVLIIMSFCGASFSNIIFAKRKWSRAVLFNYRHLYFQIRWSKSPFCNQRKFDTIDLGLSLVFLAC